MDHLNKPIFSHVHSCQRHLYLESLWRYLETSLIANDHTTLAIMKWQLVPVTKSNFSLISECWDNLKHLQEVQSVAEGVGGGRRAGGTVLGYSQCNTAFGGVVLFFPLATVSVTHYLCWCSVVLPSRLKTHQYQWGSSFLLRDPGTIEAVLLPQGPATKEPVSSCWKAEPSRWRPQQLSGDVGATLLWREQQSPKSRTDFATSSFPFFFSVLSSGFLRLVLKINIIKYYSQLCLSPMGSYTSITGAF